MRKFLLVSASLALVLCLSCDYDPDGENFVNLPLPDSTDISIDLANLEGDTLYIYDHTEVFYKALAGIKEIKYIRGTIGDQHITAGGNNGSFMIYTYQIPDGFHSMELELIVFSGTGSLADRRDEPTFRILKTYVVAVDTSVPDPVAITSIDLKDGTLELAWYKYDKFNFEKYYLTKYVRYPLDQGYGVHWIKEIKNRSTTSLRDSTYIGGGIMYTLSVVAGPRQSTWDQKYYEHPFKLLLEWEWADKSNIKFTWRKTPFFKNFSSYNLHFSVGSDPRTFAINDVNDTTLTIDAQMTFAETKYINVVAYPHRVDTYHPDYIYANDYFYQGISFPTRYENYITYNAVLDKYFALEGGGSPSRLIRIDGTSNQGEDTIPSSSEYFAVSDNGQYLYTSKGKMLTRLDPLNFSVSQTFDLSTLLPPNSWQDRRITISNSNLLAISTGSRSYVLDMNTFTIVQEWLDGTGDSRVSISPGGGYLIKRGLIYAWNGSQFVESGGTYDPNFIIQYLFKNDEKLILTRAGTIDVIDLASGALDTQITSPASEISYDPVSDLLGGYDSNGKYYLHSLSSAVPIKSFDVKGSLVLCNDQLIAGHGYAIPLSFFYP